MDRQPETARPPGQPLLWLFVGYPVWWILGVTEFAALIACGLLAIELAHTRERIRVPGGFWLWLLFLAWVFAGVLMLHVSAPDTDPTFSSTRYITWGFRLLWYLSATVVMIHVVTFRHQLPVGRYLKHAGWMFPTLVAGGYLGAVAPMLELKSVLEILLPNSITSIQFVRDLIHPTVAQVYTFQGSFNPRPSAPFPYSNDWGVTYACTVPLFIAGWIVGQHGWRRVLSALLLIASVVPVVLSQNRGLWLALVLMVVFVAVHNLFVGHLRRSLITIGVGAVLVGLLSVSPLMGVVGERLGQEGGSDSGRVALAEATVSTVVQRAPVTGLGSTRNLEGSFYSVSGSDSALCPNCSPPALGTQGQVWLVVFSQGLVGMILYFGFMLWHLGSGLRRHGNAVVAGMAVLVAQVATAPFYNTLGPALLMVAVAIGVVTVAVTEGRPAAPVQRAPASLRSYGRTVRASATLMLVTALVGVAVGVGWQLTREPRSAVIVRVYVPATPTLFHRNERIDSMDTAAALVQTRAVVDAAADAFGQGRNPVLQTSAEPNSRVLVIAQTTTDVAAATRSVTAAAEALLKAREQTIVELREEWIGAKDRGSASMAAAGATLGTTINRLGDAARTSPMGRERVRTLQLLGTTQSESVNALIAPTGPGVILSQDTRSLAAEDWIVAPVTGGLLGLLLGVAIAAERAQRRDRSATVAPANSAGVGEE